MEIKKVFLALAMILILLSLHIYMGNKYSPVGVEIRLNEPIDLPAFERMMAGASVINYSINYEKSYKDYKLIMTTGNDLLFNNIQMMEGEFITNKDKDFVILGDKVSDKYFRSVDVIGKRINIFGMYYEIKGVLKNSNEIYVSYDKDRLSENWDRTIVRIEQMLGDSYKNYYLRANQAVGGLNNNSYQVLDSVKYMNMVYYFQGLASIIFISMLLGLIRALLKSKKSIILGKQEDYKLRIREMSIFKYLLINKKDLLRVFIRLAFTMAAAYSIYKLFPIIRVDKDYLPDNIFSISSYLLILKNYINVWKFRLENGLSPIMLDFIILNAIIFIAFLTLILVVFRNKVGSKSKEEASGENVNY